MACSSKQCVNKVQKTLDTVTSSGLNFEEIRDYEDAMEKALQELGILHSSFHSKIIVTNNDLHRVRYKFGKARKKYIQKRNEVIKRLPEFWVKVFLSHPETRMLLGKKEVDCLKYLKKLNVEDGNMLNSGYRIDFHFDENPYFENTVITKELLHASSANPTLRNTNIRWKDQSLKKTRVYRGRKRPLEDKTLFTWFCEQDPNDDITKVIKDDIWLNAPRYYMICINKETEDGKNNNGDNDRENKNETENGVGGADKEGRKENEHCD